MRLRFYIGFTLAFGALGEVNPNCVWAQQKGDKVVVVVSDAKIDAPGRDAVVAEAGQILEVRGTRGNWLKVTNGETGWIAKGAVISLSEAEAYFQAKTTSEKVELADFHALAQMRGAQVGWQNAVAVYDSALKTFPDSAMAYFHRGMANSRLGKTKEAVADYEKAIELDGGLVAAMNNLAWIRATGEAEFRDGEKALVLAAKARELTKGQDGSILDTLAAAHAEAGRFQEAMKWQVAAIRLKDRGPAADPLYQRLKLYSAKQAFRAKSH
jgi:tetratricopeptide (TPR) repeat protein